MIIDHCDARSDPFSAAGANASTSVPQTWYIRGGRLNPRTDLRLSRRNRVAHPAHTGVWIDGVADR